MTMGKKVNHTVRDLELAQKFAIAEKYHLMSFSDGVNSAEHVIRVVELETAIRQVSLKLCQSRDPIV